MRLQGLLALLAGAACTPAKTQSASPSATQTAPGAALSATQTAPGAALSATQTALSAAPAAPGFHFELMTTAGVGEMPVRIDVEGEVVTLVRAEATSEGQPIGVFRARLGAGDRAHIERAVPDAADPAPPIPPETPSIRVVLRSNGRNVDRRFGLPSLSPSTAAILDVASHLEELALRSPYRAFRLEVAAPSAPPVAGRPITLRVGLVNAGTEPLTLTFEAGAPHLEAAPPPPLPRPGFTPLPVVWTRISADLGRGPFTLPQGGRVELDALATFHEPGQRAVWARLDGQVTLRGTGPEETHFRGLCVARPIVVTVVARP
ncbi:hypothetical protein [Sorangium sp. So ce341]|uniref:hypothetical protein n=1 Tax=Sorangium sp. So ce341 TaxID=3133302 RepID=UPI003F5E3240